VQLINSVLRGWVNYFAVGHSSEGFSFIRDWVEKKIRRHERIPESAGLRLEEVE
jgi:RNA-directed DNA polymerase